MGPDNRMRQDSVERHGVVIKGWVLPAWIKRGDLGCGQDIKRVDIEARVIKSDIIVVDDKT